MFRKTSKSVIFVFLLLLVAGCNSDPDSDSKLSKSAQRGEEVFKGHCMGCHSIDSVGSSSAGPNLTGIFNQKAGTRRRFNGYSEALRNADFVWDRKNLDSFLSDPRNWLPGNQMAFYGLPDEQERASLIDRLAASK
jgi:cytochrome c